MRFQRGIFGATDDWADTTDARSFGQWLYGVGLASVLAVYAVSVLVTGRESSLATWDRVLF